MNTQRGFLPLLPLLIAAVIVLTGAGGYMALRTNQLSPAQQPAPIGDDSPNKPLPIITSFEECAAAGYPIQESYPRRCTSPDFGTFVEVITSDASCAAVLCPVGSTCKNGKCLEPKTATSQDPCMYTKCTVGYRCETGTGKCLKSDPCFMMDCFEPGTTCKEGRCVKKASATCSVPCTGMAPSPTVTKACPGFTTESQCAAFTSTEFPFTCEWRPSDYVCPAYP